MIFNGITMAFIPTRDAEAARRFYEGTLGMRFLADDQFAIAMEANGTPVRIVRVGGFTPQPFTILGWQVPDIASAAATLAQTGVQLEHFSLPGQGSDGIWHAPDGAAQVAWFKDPDGNILSISQHA